MSRIGRRPLAWAAARIPPAIAYSVDQIVAVTRGRHSIKFGALYQKWKSGRNNETVPEFQFANAADLFANNPSQITISFGVRPYTLRHWVMGYFVQDDIRVIRNFILNVGVRADWFSVLTEDSRRLFNRTGSFGIGPHTPSDSIYQSNHFDYSPRLGFAWTVTPKTVIRGGSGIFTSARNQFGGPVELIQNAIDEPNRVVFTNAEAKRLGLSYPTTNAAVLPLVKGSGTIAGTVISQHFPQPYAIQWTMSVAREIGKNLSVESAYMGNHAVHANVVRRINQVNPVTGQLPFPTHSEYNYYDGSESSRYNSWQTTVRRRFAQGFQAGLAYTWARSISFSDAANIGFPLPLDGWQVSGIRTAETGPPINLTQSTAYQSTRPDYVGGNPYLADAETTLQYLNKAAFARIPIGMANAPLRFGNIGRNALTGPGFWNLDLGIAKNLKFSERYRLQIRADLFNSLNHTNFSGISTGIEAGNSGRFTSTRGARVAQFHARITF
jgi:hypothetical protein